MTKHSIEDKFNQCIEQVQEQLDESFPNRFIISTLGIEKLNTKSLMARILIKDTQKRMEAQIYDRFYKLGNHYMFHNFWDNLNKFVLEQREENQMEENINNEDKLKEHLQSLSKEMLIELYLQKCYDYKLLESVAVTPKFDFNQEV